MNRSLLAISLLFSTLFVLAQTNPPPHLLSNSNIKFFGFEDESSTEFPLYMTGWSGVSAFAPATQPAPDTLQGNGDVTLLPSGHDMLLQGIKNEGTGGISIRGNGTDGTAPLCIVVSVNTENVTGLTIKWTAVLVHNFVNSASEIHMQYRIGDSGKWTNVSGHIFSMKTYGAENLPPETFGPFVLPDSANGKPVVQFRWMTVKNDALGGRTGRGKIDSIIITTATAQPVPPITDFIVSKTNPGSGEPLTFRDKSQGEPTSFAWDFGDGTSDTKKNPLKVYEQNGTYSVTLISSNSVGSDTMYKEDFITVGPLSVERKNPMLFSYFPNPANNHLTIKKQDELITDYKVLNINGQMIKNGSFVREESIDILGLSSGTYILQLLDSRTQSHSLFIKE